MCKTYFPDLFHVFKSIRGAGFAGIDFLKPLQARV
jgi:hypothetical protein